MGQDDVGQVLKSAYPDYIDYKQIARTIRLSNKRTVQKILASMRKRGEVEYIIVKSNANRGVWITKYRIRRK